MEVRQLSDAELVALIAQSGISPNTLAKIAAPDVVASLDDPSELQVVEWGYADKVRFLFDVALYGPRPH